MEYGGDGDGGDGGDGDGDGENTSWWMRSDYGSGCEFRGFFCRLSSKGRGAFTIYIGFDEPNPTLGRTAGRYGRPVVPLVVKFSAT